MTKLDEPTFTGTGAVVLTPVIGETYDVRHTRFGTCVARVTGSDGGDFWYTTIVGGHLFGARHDWAAGDEKPMRKTHVTFYARGAT